MRSLWARARVERVLVYSVKELEAVDDAPLKGVSMLKLSLPPAWKMQTTARYSPPAGAVTAATEPARRRLSRVFRTEMLLTAAQLAWPRKRRRERRSRFIKVN